MGTVPFLRRRDIAEGHARAVAAASHNDTASAHVEAVFDTTANRSAAAIQTRQSACIRAFTEFTKH
jgi:hypothetical protein